MKKLAVVFPGIGYHCDKPLLYYGRKVLAEEGFAECILLHYTFDGGNIRGNAEKMQEAFFSLHKQAKEQLTQVQWDSYEEIVFLSKSIGTAIGAAIARELQLPQIKQILYTPLEQTYQFDPQNAIAFIGTKDPWSEVEQVIALSKAADVPIHVYEGCNHSLECEDVLRNLDILKDVMEKTTIFCNCSEPSIIS